MIEGQNDGGAALRSFRTNCDMPVQALVCDFLRAEGFEFEPEPFSPSAFRLVYEPFPLGRSLAAFFGLIYIQDRSSMLPPLVLQPAADSVALDMCASPGSKTGFLSQLVGKAGCVLGNEPNPARLGTLRANLSAQNLMQAITCRFPAQELPLPEGGFAWVLLDPPCSGWGTAEKNPQVMKLWSGNKTKILAALQRQLLAKAAQLLCPGGQMVYSTCTTNFAENEEQVVWALENLPLEQVELTEPPGFADALSVREGSIHVDPGLGEGQGFFVAKFRRKSEGGFSAQNEDSLHRTGEPFEFIDRSALDSDLIDSGLLPPGELAEFRGNVMFLPRVIMEKLPSGFPVQGCFVGKSAQGSVLPLPRMRTLMRPAGEGPTLDLEDLEPLTRLLSGQSIEVCFPGSGRLGLYYKSLPLALLRVKGGRAIWTER